ncbi:MULTISPECIES: GNAT family N-acetyltransferase [Novosphingobium]|uniref:Acetyltransferase (GNAT) family protein n=1 Tax=Novosphingobium mathurense TaxID=428990 RepID=A0A1U6IHD7_9SPHN|nr:MULTISPECIES: GNAT family N-acetyltransferase [Novosphingobium]CDO36305.1 Acetyltransferase (GNAT) family protein [Novosphingobium sp. KN65.2]SLK07438.1 Acetyltransferase (GNAT) family protein [Novosphingobium mathurense]
MPAIEYSDDTSRLDIARIHGWLASSYWTPGIAREQVERQIAGSHCLGAYRADGGQVGFARVISDRASFAWLADVWVDERARGQGLGTELVRWFLAHPDYAGVRRFALATKDAHGVYAKLGFTPLVRPDWQMENLSGPFAALPDQD